MSDDDTRPMPPVSGSRFRRSVTQSNGRFYAFLIWSFMIFIILIGSITKLAG